MNELLKGLIGAELTLLGVSGQIAQDEPSAGGSHGKSATGKGAAAAGEDDTEGSRPSVSFNQCDYRTAAG
jgi:hypothetical protein